MNKYPVINMGQLPAPRGGGVLPPPSPSSLEFNPEVASVEEWMRNEAARADRMNREAMEAQRGGDFAAVDAYLKIAQQASRNWQSGQAQIERIRKRIEERQRPPVATPGSRPPGMRIPTLPFGSLFKTAGVSPISMVSPAGPSGFAQ